MVTSQRDESVSIQAFLKWQEDQGLWCHGTKQPKQKMQSPRYMLKSTLQDYLQRDGRVEILLQELFRHDDPHDNPPDADIIRKHYLRPFVILLRLHQGSMIKLFTKYENLQDHKLPILSKPPNFPISAEIDLWEAFKKNQWLFCPVRLQYGMSRDVLPEEILPFQFEELLGRGGESSVYKVKIHPECHSLLPTPKARTIANAQISHDFVVKTYRGQDAKTFYDAETRAFYKLRVDNRPPPNIITYYGSFIQNNTYNIILEYANKGTLEEVMEHNNAPRSGGDVIRFWEQIFQLFKGLGQIHGVEKEGQGHHQMLGWHQDIKPANILVKRPHDTLTHSYEFFVADMGLSHFKPSTGRQKDASDKDGGGTYTYGAPELFHKNDDEITVRVGRHVDLWSLGCIFSEIGVWIDGGWPGVQEYRRLREIEVTKKVGPGEGELFHDGSKVLSLVTKTNRAVVGRRDDFVTRQALRDLVEPILMAKADEQENAGQYFTRSTQIIRRAKVDMLEYTEMERAKETQGDNTAPESQFLTDITHVKVQEPMGSNRPPTVILNDPDKTIGDPALPPPHLSCNQALEIIGRKRWPRKVAFPNKDLLQDLKTMDHVFLIDTSDAMGNYSFEVKGVFKVLAAIVKNLSPEGVDIFFTTAGDPIRGWKHSYQLSSSLKKVKFSGTSDMAARLGDLLDEYKEELNFPKATRRSMFHRPKSTDLHRRRNIYVLTDGIWQPGCAKDVLPAIQSMTKRLQAHGNAAKNRMGIQFIQFGNDDRARNFLKSLKSPPPPDDDPSLRVDMVDTTSSQGNVWKMLLGATKRWFDHDEGHQRKEVNQTQTGPTHGLPQAYFTQDIVDTLGSKRVCRIRLDELSDLNVGPNQDNAREHHFSCYKIFSLDSNAWVTN
ncbi:uncharacterized protein KY384_001177 [Bacidia gigantensis]|uniref:uncharacterized protein n=1 Tax=Bacidia gigantensis TaxID=2732470 RepID=UPI001D048B21|nr:uncharacterized protein KY384_001177 [Bacidia gigantensis]KAG8534333.1 hypothetical protein KY384_001177 [Bacidia gigantensis]